MRIYAFIEQEKAAHSVRTLCRVLKVSASGFWAWRKRAPCARTQANAHLTQQITTIHQASYATYGAPRVHAELVARGVICGRKRVARLMRTAGLVGVQRRHRIVTTQRTDGVPAVADLVQRAFSASAPDRLWVGDITYVPTAQGFLYLAIILDVCSRRIVGWAMGPSLHTDLVLRALRLAVRQRRPARGLIHHSDHGVQYTAGAFQTYCRLVGLRCSRGSVGDCYDNAMAESFFATLECELLSRETFGTHAAARAALFAYIEGFYNRRRRHSALGYLAPADFETQYTNRQESA